MVFQGDVTAMQLTEEQHRLVEAAQGKPVDVVDAQTNRAYVLLPVEMYQRVRDLLEGSAAAPDGSAVRSEGLVLPVKLRELPTPPEIAEEVRKRCMQLGIWGRKNVQRVEDELKLQYYFGGKYVAYFRSDQGPVIVAAGRSDSEEVGRQLDALSREERQKLIHCFPTVWNDEVSEYGSLFRYES